MRRYTLNVSNREFVIDVQEVDADQFEVTVGDECYAVTLAGDEAMAGEVVAAAPRAAAPKSAPAPAAAPAPVARKQPAGGGGKGAVKAPMPGVILEVSVKAGDKVTRGQQIAVLDAMKMHNVIGAPRDGTIAEIFVAAGQNVGHGDAIATFKEE